MAYPESTTFGGGGIDIATQKEKTEFFIGATYSTTQVIATTAKAAGGIDTGNENGMYRLLYDISVRVVGKIATPTADRIKFTIYESDDNSTFIAGSSWETTIEKVNNARRTPVSFPLPSCTARYIVLGIQLTGTSAVNTAAATAGTLLVSALPVSY